MEYTTRSQLIPAEWAVPQAFHDRIGDRAGRQRVLQHNDDLLLLLHEPPHPDQPTRQARLFWRNGAGEWRATIAGGTISPLQLHLDEFAAAIDHWDHLENAAVTAQEYFAVLAAVAPLKRSAQNLHHVLEEARKLVPSDRALINFRDQAYDLGRTAELLYDASHNGMDMARTRRAEEQAAAGQAMAESAHHLNQFVAFFFPLATLTAVFGMQLQNGLETYRAPYTFLTVCALGLCAGALFSWFLRRPSPPRAGKPSGKSP